MKTINVIGIIHKEPSTPYGISFPGLPDPVFELRDDCGLDFASEISGLLKEYFLHMIQIGKFVQLDIEGQSMAISEATDNPAWAGHTESVVTIGKNSVDVSTTVHMIEIDGT